MSESADTHPVASARPSLLRQLKSFPAIFWIANWMELIERFAYYGLRTVIPTYMVLAYEEGGPQFTHHQKGRIFAVWAMVQSFLPILTGGFADRYGYKLNIVIATFIKVAGYLVMGFAIELGAILDHGSIAELHGAAGGPYTYPIFFAGAILLATGTAIFKPGLQGIIANQMPEESASVGWSTFYQMVNIGGFLGPFFAGYLRLMAWKWVFVACAGAIMLNFLPLFFFAEPARKKESFAGKGGLGVLKESIVGLFRPRVFFFTILFSGFWLMFFQLFDILPNFIDDWVDSRAVVAALQSTIGHVITIPVVPGTGNLPQEWMINLDALMISLFAFAMGYLTGKVRSLPAMIIGIGISVLSIWMLGLSMNGWWTLLAIAVFSIGEMTASPTLNRYMAAIAPPGQEGLFMGYVNATVGIGWSIGSVVAGDLYESGGDKVNLARKHLLDVLHVPAEQVSGLAKTEVLPFLQAHLGLDADATRQFLWDTYHPYAMWSTFAWIGFASMIGLLLYDIVLKRLDPKYAHSEH